MRIAQKEIQRAVDVRASPERVWHEVTRLDIAAFSHPAYLSILGIPKPLRAEILQAGVGGARVAYFERGRRFSQQITDWQPGRRYAFTFRADPGFRVAYVLDLSNGPFRMIAGAYDLSANPTGTRLSLLSLYELRGVAGVCLGVPVRMVLDLFQRYLLRSIRASAERVRYLG
jgi:hypothetical protein